MNNEIIAKKYDDAMNILDDHVHQQLDGTFKLDTSDYNTLGIEEGIFRDLSMSLEHTNKLIRAGELNPSDIT